LIQLAQFEIMNQHRLGEYLIAASVVLLTFWFVFRLTRGRRNAAASVDANLTPREKIERIKQMGGMRNDLRELMVEIEQMARRVGAQLDAKTMHMEQLLEEADQKIARLNSIVTSPPPGSAPVESSGEAVESPSDPLISKIYELADAGQDSIQIAQQLDEHVGKVELVLALREQSAQSNRT
jgi:hypothetical protein